MTLTFADEVEDDLHLLSEAQRLDLIVSDLPLDGQPLAVTATSNVTCDRNKEP